MKRGHPKQMSESFLTAAFLSLSGGLQDAYTYIYRGHVFANAQTGNIVLLSQSIAERNWTQTLEYLIPLSFFAFGIAAAELLRFRYQSTTRIHWRQLVLLFEIAILFAVGFMPETCDLIANGIVSFACAMQVQTFRKVKGYSFASTMCIGNLRSGMESLCAYWKTQNRTNLQKSFCYWGIILLSAPRSASSASPRLGRGQSGSPAFCFRSASCSCSRRRTWKSLRKRLKKSRKKSFFNKKPPYWGGELRKH